MSKTRFLHQNHTQKMECLLPLMVLWISWVLMLFNLTFNLFNFLVVLFLMLKYLKSKIIQFNVQHLTCQLQAPKMRILHVSFDTRYLFIFLIKWNIYICVVFKFQLSWFISHPQSIFNRFFFSRHYRSWAWISSSIWALLY